MLHAWEQSGIAHSTSVLKPQQLSLITRPQIGGGYVSKSKFLFKRQDSMVVTGLIWLQTETSGGPL